MRIEVWADIICPICGMTELRLRNAVKRFAHGDEVEIIHRSFQVHPGLPETGATQRQLASDAGMSAAQIEAILRPVERAADTEGFGGYHAIERTLGPTALTHELLAYASDQGKGEEAWAAMFDAHFRSNRQLWTIDQLVEFASEIGLDPKKARSVLTSRKYRGRVEEEQRRAVQLGAKGTPFIVIGGKYGIGGGTDTNAIVSVLQRAWHESHPTPLTMPLGQGNICGPDGTCPI